MNNPQRKTGSATDNRYLSATHEVINQPRPLENYNLYEQDTALREAVLREGAGFANDDLCGGEGGAPPLRLLPEESLDLRCADQPPRALRLRGVQRV